MAKNSNTKNNTINNFKFDEAYDKSKWAEHFGENFTEKYGSISSEEEILEKNKDFLKSVIWIGDLNVCDNNDEPIGVYEVRITNTRLASRVKISRLCSKILSAGEYGKGIFFILYEDKEGIYRVSYVKHDRIGVFVGDAIEIKKDYSNPKRYTFLLGEGIKVHTPQSRLTSDIFKSVASIENAFSVEGVNQEFYKGIEKYFEYIHNDVIKYFDKDENKAKEFALRFLGRVLFCWFLREKELIPNDILNSGVFENLKYKENYYSDVLEDLFFNVLNMDMEKRKFSKDRVIYNYEKSIPFLNGGLFSKKEDDEAVKTIDDDIIKGLFEFFDMYNFTVDESAPFDVEISIDPEMLGRIFENLLAEINPETEKSAKDESGSFYTPREIVDYMVIEAIKLYLYKKLPDMKDKIDGIFDVEESIEYSDKERELILKNIHDMIILDPACGSGAFPLGILQRVFNVIDKLDPKHEYYKELTLKDVTDPIVKAKYEKFYSTKEFNYIYKLFILQNNIHGVDIQPIAVEISRLRAFLSLIIDEEKNEKEDNLGINPLPNLDFQFICANTLVPLKLNPTEKMFIEGHIKNLRKSMNNYFNVHDKEDKKVAENDVEAFFEQIERDESLERETKNIICSWHPFKNKPSLYFDYKLQFGLDRKFDIVIGNPPYIQIQGMANRLKEMYQNVGYETFKSTGDIYQLFYEKCLFLLSDDGVASLITSNKWMRAGYGASTREYFYKNADVFRIIDLGAGRFESATVDVNIILYSKTKEKNIRGERSFKGATYSGSLKDIRSAEFYDVVSDAGKEWVIMSGLEKSIFNKISKHKALKDWDIKINYGIKTGYNEAFIIDEETKERLIKEDKKSAELIKPLVRGRDIKRYSYDFKKLYIIGTFPALKLNIDKYKAIKKYLESFGKRLEQSGEKGCRKKTGNKWFETQDNIAYYKDFEKSKIFWKAIGFNLGFTIAEKGVCVSAPSSFITSNCNEYLLGILSSSVTRYYIYKYSDKTGAGDVMLSIQSLEKIPIPEADSKSKNKIVKLVDKIIEFKKQGQDTSDLEREVDEIVYYLYGLSEDEIRVIEG
ncbi:Eco57I restriction-modification methylase domain-containing protein [Brachyspira intermedia]|uniref:Eco57I restriction-modification methylase domain-containing protein n=1 Tax=Brachyspira intermedia TaxID=84377 RepID=UPI0030078DA6